MSSSKVILVEGVLHKKGHINMSWKQRYFVLYGNGTILYWENYHDSKNKNKKENGEINLNEVKSLNIITKNTTTKKSDREYTFQLITSSRTYTLSCNHDKQFKKWSNYIKQFVYGKNIHKGYLFKLGAKRKTWKKRYFVLYDTKKYYIMKMKNV